MSGFVKFVEHYDGFTEKSCICSAGPWENFKDKRNQCFGCDIYWETASRNSEGRWQSSRMSKQAKYAFNTFDYGVYHKLEQIDRDTGKPKLNPKNQQPYFNWVKCIGQGCDACKAGKESKTGNMMHWPINFTQLQVLRSVENDIGASCFGCGTYNSIISRGWMCQKCGECIIDMSTTELKKEELLEITDNPVHCPHCNTEDVLQELLDCAVCKVKGTKGSRASLYDVDLRVKLVSNGTQKVLQVCGWSQPYAVTSDQIKPLDLLSKYAPSTLEYQASQFGLSPAQGQAAAPQRDSQPARAYSVPYNK
jgi:hypothetical protein